MTLQCLKLKQSLWRYIEVVLLIVYHISYTAVLFNIGVIIYDLLLQNHASLSKSTYIYVSQGIGCLLADVFVICAFMITKSSNVLVFTLFAPGIFWLCMGFSKNFILTNIAIVFATMFAEGGTVVTMAYISDVWRELSPAIFLVVLTGVPLGNVVSPLLYLPYLSQHAVRYSQRAAGHMGCYANKALRNMTDGEQNIFYNTPRTHLIALPEVRILTPISIHSAVFISTAILFCALRFVVFKNESEYEEMDAGAEITSKISDLKGLCAGGALVFFNNGAVAILGNLTTQFVVECYAEMTTVKAAYLLSVFHFLTLTDRIIMAIIVPYTGAPILLTMHLLAACVGAVIIEFFAGNVTLMWIGFMTIGLAMGTVFPLTVGWIKERLYPNKLELSLLFFGGVIGHAVFTTSISVVMNHFGSHVYSISLIVVYVCGNFVLILSEILIHFGLLKLKPNRPGK